MRITTIVDWFVIIVSIVFQLSIIPAFLFDGLPFNSVYALTLFLITFQIVRFGGRFPFIKCIKVHLFQIYFLIYLTDVISCIIVKGTGLQVLFRMVNMMLFLNYIYNVFLENTNKDWFYNIKRIMWPYFSFAAYNAFIVTILFIWFFLGLDYLQNPLPYDLSTIEDNTLNGIQYYFPYYLSVASDYHPMFGYPVFTGLFHEPHIINFFSLPALFWGTLLVRNTKLRFLVICCFIALLANTISTTAIVCVGVVWFTETIWSAIISRKYMFFLLTSLLMIFAIITFANYFDEVITLMTFKMEGGDSSQGTSSTMLKYLMSFDQLIGEGNCPQKYGEALKGQSAGMITAILDFSLFFYMLFLTVKSVISRDKKLHYIGLGCLYFLLHCLKVNYLAFQYPYLAYILFVIYIQDKYSTSKKHLALKMHPRNYKEKYEKNI